MSGQIKVDDLFRNIGPDAAGQLRGHQRFLLCAEKPQYEVVRTAENF